MCGPNCVSSSDCPASDESCMMLFDKSCMRSLRVMYVGEATPLSPTGDARPASVPML